MKTLVALALFTLSVTAIAHDEGHGPKITDPAKQGGIVSPVVEAKDAKLGTKAALHYKAELVRSEDGTVQVYLYDKEMNPVDLKSFDKTAKGILAFKKNKKWTNQNFEIKQGEGFFTGAAPKAGSKPFNIDFHIKGGGKEYLTAFDNLD